jgi:HK97 family phage prohead protease
VQFKINQSLIIKSAQNNDFIISGYASVYNFVDQHNDIIIQGAFTSLENKNIKFLWQHQQTKPIGIIQTINEDNYGLKIEAVINDKVEAGREAIELIKQGAVDSLSIGFNIISSSYNDQGQRIIEKAELIEISLVTFPANDRAQINYIPQNNPSSNYNHNFKGVNMNEELTQKK